MYKKDKDDKFILDENGNKIVIIPATRMKACLERMSRPQIHDTPAPASVGVIAAYLKHVLSTMKVMKNQTYQGHPENDYVIWSNGVGVSRYEDKSQFLGNCVKVTTGKGGHSGPSFTKHLKMYQCLALSSFLHFPINCAFGDGAIDVTRIT